MADRIVAMNGGIIQQVGTPLELYDDPANRFVAEFIGSPAMNFLDAQIATAMGRTQLRLGNLVLTEILAPPGSPTDGRVVAGIRPERVLLGNRSSAIDAISARVVLVEPTGVGTVVHLELGGQFLKLFTTERLKLAIGDIIQISIKADDVRLFHPQTGITLRPAS